MKLQAQATGKSLALALSGTRFAILKTQVSGPVSLDLMLDHACETQDPFISQWENMLPTQKNHLLAHLLLIVYIGLQPVR